MKNSVGNKIKKTAGSFLTSGKFVYMKGKKDMDAMLRLIVLNITYISVSIFIMSMGISAMRNGIVDEGLLQLIIGFMILLNLLLLRTELPFVVGGLIITVIFGAFCGVSLYTKNTLEGFDCIWIFSFPLMSIFALGLPLGFIPAFILLVASGIGLFIPELTEFHYSVQEGLIICGMYSFILVLSALYEYARSIKETWLTQQENYMHLVFSNSPDIILVIDKNIKLVYCADVFIKKARFKSTDDVYLRNYREVFAAFTTQEELKSITDQFAKAMKIKKSIIMEMGLDIGRDGDPRNYQIHFTPMHDEKGDFQGAFVIFQDITEILDARDKAQAASVAKSNFLANMSHEIRTPINAVIGMTAIARSTGDAKQKEYCLDKIEGASTHLLGIINDILDMSKIEAGKFELFSADFEFKKVIDRVLNVFEFRLTEKQQRFSLEINPDVPPFLFADEQRLGQVITNLLTNAIKFTPVKGSIELKVNCLENAGNSCVLEFYVIDTGIGISKEQQEKLFKSFVQVDNTISRKFGGTGLGLAICKKIVVMMGGDISIESEKGKGSVFRFTVRAGIPDKKTKANQNENQDKQSGSGENVLHAGGIDFSNRKILLAEDMEINREIVVTILEPTGIKIVEAENGQDAFDKFTAAPDTFDLIFMDIHMPGIDGYEATHMIRSCDAYGAATIPIIAMTANVFKEDIENCLAAGMSGHIGKPIDFNNLINLLKKYLS